jgi:hypothetical protein
MASGKPDWNRVVTIQGKYNDNFVPVVVDANGQMYIALTGQQVQVNNLPSDYFKSGENVAVPAGTSVTNLPSDYFKSGENVAVPAGTNVNNLPSDYYKSGQAVGSITNNVNVAQVDSNRVVTGNVGVPAGVDVNNHPSDYYKAGEAVGSITNNVNVAQVDSNRVVSGSVSVPAGVDVNNHPSDYFKSGEAVGSITNNVTVDQSDGDRVMKGTEGVNKRYLAVDSNGVMLARMKGADGGVLRDVLVDSSGIMVARMKGAYGAVLKDVLLDDTGIMISRMKGAYGATLKDIYVDTSGKMVARVQGVGAGEEQVFMLDDGGDTTTITDWVESIDALNPVDTEDYVKEGSHGMKLGIDASLHGEDNALWTNSQSIGDLGAYRHDWVYMWLYFNTIDYLEASGVAVMYRIGSDSSNYMAFYVYKASLSVGWNLLKFDLDNPGGTAGSPDFTAISYQILRIYEASSNTNDFFCVVDSINVVELNPSAGSLFDVAVDKDGLMLTKMVGNYGGLMKPVGVDQYGNMRINIARQDLWTHVSNPHNGNIVSTNLSRSHPGIETYTLLDVAGPGVVLGGTLYHTTNSTHKDCKPIITIDGVAIHDISFAELNNYALTEPWEYIPHLTRYDDVTWEYNAGFPNGLTFASQLKVQIDERVGADGATYLYMFYCLL